MLKQDKKVETIPFIDIHTHTEKNANAVFSLLPNQNMQDIEHVNMFSIGWHPWHLMKERAETTLHKIELLATDNRVVAIGETGLDKLCASSSDYQQEIFKWHILLSEKVQKPLIIHCVKAFNEMLEMKKQMQPKMTWIVHGFNNKPEIASQLLRAGVKLSFGKALLNKLSNASTVIKELKPSDFFLETDDCAAGIEEVYSKATYFRNCDIAQLRNEMYQNFINTFQH